MPQQIILRDLQKPKNIDVGEDINWIVDSFGFSAGRDTKRVAAQILQSVIHEFAQKGATSSEKVANELNISVQRVNYHLRSIIDSGFLLREKRLIFIRQGSVKDAIEEMRRDANRIFDNLTIIAKEIDEILGIKNRARPTTYKNHTMYKTY